MRIAVEEQMKIILKGVETVVQEEELREKLMKSEKTGEPLVVKLGLDPSAPDIHIGHAVVLRKIRQMQDLGHRAVIIIGDFTGKIGDPTGKSKGRAALSEEQVKLNAITYQEQIFKILREDRTDVRFNGEWLGSLNFEQVLRLAATTTVARLIERDDFQNRFRNNIPIGLHEFFYPLMQAYDSVEIKADIELGGTDQTFNILMGRTLQKNIGQEQQIALFMPLLEGLDGKEKMSKSLGNYIGIYEDANIMFKKVMEIPDELILKYYELATDEHPDRITQWKAALESGQNPRDVKFDLAHNITQLYHSEEETRKAREYYDIAFGKKGIPDQIPELIVKGDADTVLDLVSQLAQGGHITSNSEFRRLQQQGGIQLNGAKVSDLQQSIKDQDVLKIGKKKFLKIKFL